MMFLSLWIAGQTGAWCFSVQNAPQNRYASRMMIFLVTLFPLFWASYVALTRLQDYVSFLCISILLYYSNYKVYNTQRHHKEDIIVGSFIGIVSASLSYVIFWPNPFLSNSFDVPTYGQPRVLYTEDTTSGHTEFQLTDLEEDRVDTVV
jgi:c-di-AMP phosphodiesterase-like protein